MQIETSQFVAHAVHLIPLWRCKDIFYVDGTTRDKTKTKTSR